MKRYAWVIPALLAIVVYAPMLCAWFWRGDDLVWVAAGKSIIENPLHGQYTVWQFFRPLIALSFALDWLVYGWNAWGYYLTNILLHVFNVLMVWLIASKLLKSQVGVIVATSIFAVSCRSCYAPGWLSGRTELLGTCFMLLTCVLYMRKVHPAIWIITSLLACFAKESSVSLILILPLLSLWQKESINWKSLAVQGVLVMAFLYLSMKHFSASSDRLQIHLIASSLILFRSFGQLVWPIASPVYGTPFVSWMLVCSIAVIIIALLMKRNGVLALVLSVAFCLPYAVFRTDLAALHSWYLYKPMIGIALLVGILASNVKNMRPVVAAYILLIVVSTMFSLSERCESTNVTRKLIQSLPNRLPDGCELVIYGMGDNSYSPNAISYLLYGQPNLVKSISGQHPTRKDAHYAILNKSAALSFRSEIHRFTHAAADDGVRVYTNIAISPAENALPDPGVSILTSAALTNILIIDAERSGAVSPYVTLGLSFSPLVLVVVPVVRENAIPLWMGMTN